jgi:hypothetical protein
LIDESSGPARHTQVVFGTHQIASTVSAALDGHGVVKMGPGINRKGQELRKVIKISDNIMDDSYNMTSRSNG